MKKIILLLVAIALLVAACGAESDSAATTSSTTTTVVTTTEGNSKPDAKLSSHLVDAADLAAEGVAIDAIAERVPVLQVIDGLVLIEITYDSVTADRVAAAEAAGLVVSGEYPDLLMVTGSAAPQDLRALAGLEGVASIQPAFGATTNS